MKKNASVKAFIGYFDVIDSINETLRREGIETKVIWKERVGNVVLKVNSKDYFKAVGLGAMHAVANGLTVNAVSPANKRMFNTELIAAYYNYKAQKSRHIRVKTFIGKNVEIESICSILRAAGINSADLAWCEQPNNETIKVDMEDYYDAVALGSVFASDQSFQNVSIVSPASERMNEIKAVGDYARYKYEIKEPLFKEIYSEME